MRGALLIPLVTLTSCVTFNYVRFRTNEPIPPTTLAELIPGLSSLGDCLSMLGAPEIVWPSEAGKINIAYATIDAVDWGLSVNYSFDRFVSTGIEIDATDQRIAAVALLFDENLLLFSIRRGFLRDLKGEPAERDPALGTLDVAR
jgi:hypothetical protein